ncbi:hypothetical protein GALMADRAFT_257235 [Galerina marginata CBS 339.88]|uniref:DUF6534 domain-containing protein n=1 Tax=Galerina marginata (strain CBS 339.88) TaxID=685588 RepID=A0A067SDX4_GALM3|nr:hypothetical protein GALMADRAFT_257235 [Galerina marginata CBS 339.88]
MPGLTEAQLGDLAGPMLIGYILNWSLYGALVVQCYIYYIAFPHDRLSHKLLVAGSLTLETTQALMLTYSGFRTFAYGFGNIFYLNEVDILWFSVPIMSGIIGFITQTFYAYRVSVLAQSKRIASVIMLLAVLQFVGAILTALDARDSVYWSLFLKRKSFISAGIWEGGSAACDVLIAIAMTYYLKRRETGHKQTQVLLSKLVRLTIETGTLTATVAIITLVLTFLPSRKTYYQTSVSLLGKLYSNSMLVAFNSRIQFSNSNGTSGGHSVSISLSQVHKSRAEDVETARSNGGVMVIRESQLEDSNFSQKSVDKVYDGAAFSRAM